MAARTCRLLLAVALGLCSLSCSRSPTGPNDLPWRFLPGIVEPLSFAGFRDGRQCWVYLPPGYATASRRYPVLYLNDGEIWFDGPRGLHVNRICEDLIRRGEIEPIIVVAIESVSERQRYVDYGPWPDPYRPVQPNGQGDHYLRALRDTLKPVIDARYRTLTDARNTAIGGGSLAGLISAYAGYAYDSTFGKVAAFSPSYWWDAGHLYTFARVRGRPPFLFRFYQDTGSIADNAIDEMATIAVEQGFRLGLDFVSVTAEGGYHGGDSWAHRFPDMLRFLFPPGKV